MLVEPDPDQGGLVDLICVAQVFCLRWGRSINAHPICNYSLARCPYNLPRAAHLQFHPTMCWLDDCNLIQRPANCGR